MEFEVHIEVTIFLHGDQTIERLHGAHRRVRDLRRIHRNPIAKLFESFGYEREHFSKFFGSIIGRSLFDGFFCGLFAHLERLQVVRFVQPTKVRFPEQVAALTAGARISHCPNLVVLQFAQTKRVVIDLTILRMNHIQGWRQCECQHHNWKHEVDRLPEQCKVPVAELQLLVLNGPELLRVEREAIESLQVVQRMILGCLDRDRLFLRFFQSADLDEHVL